MANPFDDLPDEPPFPSEATPERPKKAPVVGEIKPAEARPPTPPICWSELSDKEPPERRWAVKGWIGFGHTTLLVGSGGIGKTLIAQQIGSALALGKQFIEEAPASPLKVLMWACEDDHDELWRRQVNIALSLNARLDDFSENFTLVPRHGQDNALVTSEFGRPAFTGLERHLAEQVNDYKADLVILDNVAQLYGAGENDRHAVTWFLNMLSGILGPRALLLLAHPSRAHGSEFSGSGAWENVARTRLYLGMTLPDQKEAAAQGDEANDYRYLARRKANYSSRDWRRFTYKEGVLVPEAVETGGGIVGRIREDRVRSIVFNGLQKILGMGIVPTNGRRSTAYLPTIMMEYNLNEGFTRDELGQGMRALIADGKIKIGSAGRNSNRTHKAGLVPAD